MLEILPSPDLIPQLHPHTKILRHFQNQLIQIQILPELLRNGIKTALAASSVVPGTRSHRIGNRLFIEGDCRGAVVAD